MGLPMARCLHAAGFQIWGHDVRPLAEFGDFQDRMVVDAGDFRARVDVVVSVVRDRRQTLDLCFGEQGVFSGPDAPGTLVVSSTLSPRFIAELSERLPAGTRLVDAPMSGAPYRALDGSLTFMVGGDDGDVEKLMPAFQAMGAVIHRLGGLGTGMTCKVLNNFVGVTGVVAVRKALASAVALGLDRHRLLEVMRTSSGGTWYGDNIANIDWAPQGYALDNTIGILEKDVNSYLDALDAGGGPFEQALLDDIRALGPLDLDFDLGFDGDVDEVDT